MASFAAASPEGAPPTAPTVAGDAGSASASSADPTKPPMSAPEDAVLAGRYFNDVVAHHSLDGAWLRISPAVRPITGWRAEQLIGRSPLEFVHPDDLQALASAIGSVSRGPVEVVIRFRRADGDYLWVESRARLTTDPHTGRAEIQSVSRDVHARVLAEQQLHRFRALAEQSPDFVAIAGPDSRLLYINPSGLALVGLPADVDVRTLSMADFIHSDDLAVLRESIAATLRDGMWSGELNFVDRAGNPIPVHQSRLAHRDRHGKLEYFSSTVRDLRAQRAAEARAHTERERYRSLVAQAPVGIFVTDPAGNNVYVNARLAEILGYPPDYVSGRLTHEHVHPEDRERLRAAWAAAKAGTGSWHLEYRVVRIDGSCRLVAASARPLCAADGALLGYLGVYDDITERRAAEQARQREATRAVSDAAAARLKAMVDGLNALVWEADVDSRRYTFASGPAQQILGRPADELVGRVRFDVPGVYPDDVLSLRRQVDDALAAARDYELEYRVRHPDGSVRWVHDAVHIACHPDGTPALLQGVTVDITETKAAQERARFFAELERALQLLHDPRQIMAEVARRLGEHLRVDRCVYGEIAADQEQFVVTGDYTAGSLPHLVGRYPVSAFGKLLADALRSGRPSVVRDVETDERLGEADRQSYRDILIRASVTVPVLKAGRLMATLTLHHVEPRNWTDPEVETAVAVAQRCWETLERTRTLQALRDSEEHHRTLFEQSSDGIWISGPDRRLVDVNDVGAAMLGYPRQELLGRDLAELFDMPPRGSVPESPAAPRGRSGNEVWTVRRADGGSVSIEVTARATNVGTLLITGRDVTARLRIEAEREEIRRREHEVADVLQRALLPAQLPALDRLATAARYLPASATARAGGDWYDLVPIGDTRIALVVGDVVGNGPTAAAIMGQLRAALASYLLDGHSPAAALERLDRFTRRISGAAGSTCACLTLDWETGELIWALAGHPPILLLEPGQGARFVSGGHGTILGVSGRPPYREARTTISPGTTLLLYTDGLVERPAQNIDVGLDHLASAAGAADGRDPDALTEYLLQHLVEQLGNFGDDVAMLAIRLLPRALDGRLAAAPTSLRRLRRAVAQWARLCALPTDLVTDLQFALGEACANAVEHAYPPGAEGAEFSYRVARTAPGDLEVVVRDRGRWRPEPADNGFRGHGLRSNRHLARSCEVRPGPDGTEVRFVLAAPDLDKASAVAPPAGAADPGAPSITIEVDTTADTRVIRLRGELDVAGVRAIHQPLLDAIRDAGARHVVVDATALTYLSSGGVALVAEASTAGTRPLEVAVRAGSAAARVLDLTGLDEALRVTTRPVG
jgi:anti-anti-sigma factor